MNEDQARKRFIVLQALRIGGVALILMAMLALNGKLALPRAAAIAMLVIGIVDFLVIPTALAKRWKSPRE